MPLYWILGQEPLQRQEYRAQVIAQIAEKHPGYRRHTFTLQTNQDWQHLQAAAQEWSDLFSDHHLIDCEIQAKIPKAGLAFLKTYISGSTSDVSFLISVAKVDWLKGSELLKSGTSYWARPVLAKDFSTWLKNYAKKKRVKLAQDAVLCLAHYTEGNVLAVHQILEKLRMLKQGVITEQDTMQYLSFQTKSSVFELTDAMLAGNTEKTFTILATLKGEGVEPHLVLWAITREVRTIIDIATAIKSGERLQAVCESLGVWQTRVALYGQAIDLIPLHRFYLLLSLAHNIDRLIKGLEPGEPYEAIGQWLLTLDRWLNKDRCFVA